MCPSDTAHYQGKVQEIAYPADSPSYEGWEQEVVYSFDSPPSQGGVPEGGGGYIKITLLPLCHKVLWILSNLSAH